MDVKVKKDAGEEMNCILDLLEEWCLKYDQDYANAVVLVKHDQITSWGSIGDHEDLVCRIKKRPQMRRQPQGALVINLFYINTRR